jgi:hypothetical protein
MTLLALPVHGQKIESYLNDMREALVPYGTMTAPTCHSVEIDLTAPVGTYLFPEHADKEVSDPSQTWAVIKVDVFRVYVDLADLDEDKVYKMSLFSGEYISNHQKGTRYVADTPVVMLNTHGLNGNLTVHAVDLDKVHALRGKTNITEDQMGLFIDLRKGAMITFSDQQHADVFQKAIQKAIVLCKAQ